MIGFKELLSPKGPSSFDQKSYDLINRILEYFELSFNLFNTTILPKGYRVLA